MPTPLNLIKNPALEYLKSHSSTHLYHIKTIGQFFTYLKDSVLSIFNSNHHFTYLGNRSVAEFNLEYIAKDLNTFLDNPSLNRPEKKDKPDYLTYTFEYLSTQVRILPNFNDVYRSGKIEPNALITQLINYAKKLKYQDVNNVELQQKIAIDTILTTIVAKLSTNVNIDTSATPLINIILSITNR